MNNKFDIEELVIYKGNDLICLNKPAGLPTLEMRDNKTVSDLLGMARKVWPQIRVCHRLDRETSGAIMLAQTDEAYRFMAIKFEHREIMKSYHAVVAGNPQLDGTLVGAPISALKNGQARIDFEAGKMAETAFYNINAWKGFSLIDCYPITGRMHQIRLHLAHIKFPIVADVLYGGKHVYLSQVKGRKFNLKQGEEERPLMQRVALHARELAFTLPSGDKLQIEAPYPKDFSALVKQLDAYAKI